LSRDLSLPSSNVQRFLNLLEVSYQLVRVPGYSVNRTRRLIKAPKVYWSDTGLALHLSAEPSGHDVGAERGPGVEPRDLRAKREETSPRGAHLENIVLTELTAWAGASPGRPGVLHWRTAGGAEVDFVVEMTDRLLPIEVKASRRVTNADARHLRTFLSDYPSAPGALLLYDGEEVF
jgi:predicted AAA+ superfamily ATPase